MNHTTIIGNITKSPRLDTTQKGRMVCSFTVAVSGGRGKLPDYFRVSAWDKYAEECYKYLKKGSSVGVLGDVHLNEWGGNYSMAINAKEIQFLKDSQTDYDPNAEEYSENADQQMQGY